jgi:hypothetical protein
MENSQWMLNFIRNNFPKGCLFKFHTDLAAKIMVNSPKVLFNITRSWPEVGLKNNYI